MILGLVIKHQNRSQEETDRFDKLPIGKRLYQNQQSDYEIFYVFGYGYDLENIDVDSYSVSQCVGPALCEQRIETIDKFVADLNLIL